MDGCEEEIGCFKIDRIHKGEVGWEHTCRPPRELPRDSRTVAITYRE